MSNIVTTLTGKGETSGFLRLESGQVATWSVNGSFSADLRLERGDTMTSYEEVRQIRSSGGGVVRGPGYFRFRVESISSGQPTVRLAAGAEEGLSSEALPADIALIGDSRTLGNYFDWSVSVVTPSGVPRSGQYAQLLGAQAGAALSETGTYEYVHATGMHRWKCGGDAFGPWQRAVVGRHLLESGSPGRGLRLMVWAPYTADITDAVTLANFRVHHSRTYINNRGGLLDRIESEFWGATVKMLGAGGGHTRDMVTLLPYFEREAGGPGIDVWWCGTNDINNDRAASAIIAYASSVLDARRALGRRIVIIGEHARWGTDTSTPLDEGKRAIHAEYDAWLRAYAADHPDECIYVDALAVTADPSATDLRPQASVPGKPDMLYDTVHPWLGAALALHDAVVAAIRTFLGPAFQRTPSRKTSDVIDFAGDSWFAGTDGTVTAPTTSTTGVPTRMTVGQTANVTSSWNKTGFTEDPGVAVEFQYTSTPGATQYTRIFSTAQTLAALGLSVGDWIQFEGIYEIDSCGVNDRFDSYALFNGPSIRASIQAPSAPGIYRLKTQPLQVPAGTTSISFRLEVYTDTAANSSGKGRFGKFLARRVSAPSTFF